MGTKEILGKCTYTQYLLSDLVTKTGVMWTAQKVTKLGEFREIRLKTFQVAWGFSPFPDNRFFIIPLQGIFWAFMSMEQTKFIGF